MKDPKTPSGIHRHSIKNSFPFCFSPLSVPFLLPLAFPLLSILSSLLSFLMSATFAFRVTLVNLSDGNYDVFVFPT